MLRGKEPFQSPGLFSLGYEELSFIATFLV